MDRYDEVRCNIQVEGAEPGELLQTKDFQCNFQLYEITTWGTLINFGRKDEDDEDIGDLLPKIYRFTGNIDLYGDSGDFVARFDGGHLVYITRKSGP